MDLILHRILATQDLGAWSKITKQFFTPPYDRIYELIHKFYIAYEKLPTFSELQIVSRTDQDTDMIRALATINCPEDLETDILVQALITEFAQREVLKGLDTYIDDLPYKEISNIVEDLSTIAIEVEDKTESNEQIVMMNEFTTIDELELLTRVPLGINNMWDQHSLGLGVTEYLMLGGHRGSGKSLICNNIICNQYEQDNASLYFTIEMRAREIFQRNLAILSGVDQHNIKAGQLNYGEQLKIAKVRAGMTSDGSEDLLEKFETNRDFNKFERELISRPLRKDCPIVTVDNPSLTIPNIEATLSNYKNRLGDKLRIVVVDYINQIESTDNYDWKSQINVSKKLKALARKYEISLITPYQTDKTTGEARFAKGILDSADWAYSLVAHKSNAEDPESQDAIEFKCQKARGDAEKDFTSSIHWETLKINPADNLTITKNSPIKGPDKKEKPAYQGPSGDDV